MAWINSNIYAVARARAHTHVTFHVRHVYIITTYTRDTWTFHACNHALAASCYSELYACMHYSTSRLASSSANTFLNSGMVSGSSDSTSARAPSFPAAFMTYTKPL